MNRNEICDITGVGNYTMCPHCDTDTTCPNKMTDKLVESCFHAKVILILNHHPCMSFTYILIIYNLKNNDALQLTYIVDNPLTVFFSVFMAIWTVLFIEFWKRETSKLQFEWDAIDFEKKMQPIRPQFELKVTQKKKNRITDVISI